MKLAWFKKKPPTETPPEDNPLTHAQPSPAATAPANGVKDITNLADLDRELEAVNQAFKISDDAGRARLHQFRYVIDKEFPSDPYSQEYQDFQLQIYHELSGQKQYDPVLNEKTPFDVAAAVKKPFPYSTLSATTVGEQLMIQGHVIKTMNLPPRSSILEFGPGWGNTTLHLAQMGYDVTAVEIDVGFVELIKRRAEILDLDVTVIQSDMATFKPDSRYDAVLFFECFHHCADHLTLLRNLEHMINPDGIIVFGAEPIMDFPQPWGFIRTDGLTIWSIREMGWFELGFNISYFLRTLLFLGWTPIHHLNPSCPSAHTITAKRANGVYNIPEMTFPPDESATWSVPEPQHRFTTKHSRLSCDQSQNVTHVEFCVSNPAPLEIPVTFTAGTNTHKTLIPKHVTRIVIRVAVADWNGAIAIDSQPWVPATIFGSEDYRELGIAVHSIQLIYKK